MGRKIAIVGAGAVGGYSGAHMVQAGEDVTFIDPWPAHVEHMRQHGLRVTHAMKEPEFTVPVRALHVTDAQQLAKEQPVDVAFVCMKSYDTAWATMLIRQYLAPDGYVVSLQNCMNEETIAGIVGWGKFTAAPPSTARRTLYFAPARCTAASRNARRRFAVWSPMPTAPK
jgi:2-dehydropantoate 2-reductase